MSDGEASLSIVQVTHRYPPSNGGVETHVRALSERLADRGHDVTVLSCDRGDGRPARQDNGRMTVRRYRSFAPGKNGYLAPGIPVAVRRADADVVHAHNYHAFPMALAIGAAGDARTVVTTHYHGGSQSVLRDGLLSMYRPVGGRVLENVDEVIAVSEWEREQLRTDFGVDATVIPNGLDAGRYANAEPESREEPYLLCVGRLERYKCIQDAVRALPDLPGYELLVAGKGPAADHVRMVAARTGVSCRVKLLGYVEGDSLPGLYAGAAATVNLSTHEAYGMTVGESLAAGTPCVVRAGSALEDWADERCVVAVQDASPSTVAAAVDSVVGCEPSPSLSTWDDVAAATLEAYGVA